VKILVEEQHDLPLARAQLTLTVGAGDDAPGDDGLTNFTTELMARGAAGRTRAEIDAAFDALGTNLDISSDHDSVSFEVTVLKKRLDAAVALLADVLLRPDFLEHEAEKLRRESRAQLDELRDDDAQLARRFFGRQLFGAHPYGRSILGTEQSFARHTPARARAWHEQALVGGNVVFGVAGDVSRAEAESLSVRHFAAVPDGAATATARPAPPLRQGQRLLLVDKPERTQSQILMGQPAPRWHDPDFFPLQVATLAFGGTFTARLMNEVRSKRGLSYGASARLNKARGARSLLVHVFPSLEQTPETVELVLRLYREWAEGGVTDEEIAFAKSYLSNSFAFNIATPEEKLDLEVAITAAGMPEDHVARYVDKIARVTRADVDRAMKGHLHPGALEICIVSTTEELEPKLREAGLLEQRTVERVAHDSY
jgi:zinc protease